MTLFRLRTIYPLKLEKNYKLHQNIVKSQDKYSLLLGENLCKISDVEYVFMKFFHLPSLTDISSTTNIILTGFILGGFIISEPSASSLQNYNTFFSFSFHYSFQYFIDILGEGLLDMFISSESRSQNRFAVIFPKELGCYQKSMT